MSRIFEDMSENERSIYLPEQSSKDDFVVAVDQQSGITDTENTKENTETSETSETSRIAEFRWTERNPSKSEQSSSKLVIDNQKLLSPTVDQKIGEIASFVTRRSLIPDHRVAISKIFSGANGIDDDGRQRNKSLSLNDRWVIFSTEEDGDASLGDNGKDEEPSKNINDEIRIPNETASINTNTSQQSNEQAQEEVETLSIPITEQDYEQDNEFRAVHSYKSTGELSGDEKQDKITLLVEEQYLIHEGMLFKLVLPRSKKEERLRPITERLCIPLKFRRALIQPVSYTHLTLPTIYSV